MTRLRRGHRSPGPDTGREPGTSPEPDSGAWWTDPGAEGSGGAGADAGRADRPEAVQASLPPLPPSSRERRPREPWIPEPPPFRTLSGPDIAGIVLLGALGIAVLVVLGLFVLNRFDQRDPVAAATPAVSGPATPTSPAPAVTTPAAVPRPAGTTPAASTRSPEVVVPGPLIGAPYSGPLTPVQPVSAGAACTAEPTDGGDGGRVRHDPELVLDDDPGTAWMCRGLAVGKRLTIRFAEPTTVAEIGIINGWAKGRAGSRSDLYRQNRRVSTVRYRFDGDRWIDDELDTTDRSVQTLRIPATTTRTVTVELREVSSAARDATAISGLTFAGPPTG